MKEWDSLDFCGHIWGIFWNHQMYIFKNPVLIKWIYCRFSRLIIIRTTKKQVRQVIEKRMMKEHHLNGVVLNRNQERQVIQIDHPASIININSYDSFQLKDQATDMANTMDLHSVKLKFECFAKNNELLEEVTFPIYSIPIYNQSMF